MSTDRHYNEPDRSRRTTTVVFVMVADLAVVYGVAHRPRLTWGLLVLAGIGTVLFMRYRNLRRTR